MEDIRNAYKLLVTISQGKNHFGDLNIDEGIIKCILKK
jgi:hypothetical protein